MPKLIMPRLFLEPIVRPTQNGVTPPQRLDTIGKGSLSAAHPDKTAAGIISHESGTTVVPPGHPLAARRIPGSRGPASAVAIVAGEKPRLVADQNYLPTLMSYLDRDDVAGVDIIEFSFAENVGERAPAQEGVKWRASVTARSAC